MGQLDASKFTRCGWRASASVWLETTLLDTLSNIIGGTLRHQSSRTNTRATRALYLVSKKLIINHLKLVRILGEYELDRNIELRNDSRWSF